MRTFDGENIAVRTLDCCLAECSKGHGTRWVHGLNWISTWLTRSASDVNPISFIASANDAATIRKNSLKPASFSRCRKEFIARSALIRFEAIERPTKRSCNRVCIWPNHIDIERTSNSNLLFIRKSPTCDLPRRHSARSDGPQSAVEFAQSSHFSGHNNCSEFMQIVIQNSYSSRIFFLINKCDQL